VPAGVLSPEGGRFARQLQPCVVAQVSHSSIKERGIWKSMKS